MKYVGNDNNRNKSKWLIGIGNLGNDSNKDEIPIRDQKVRL